MFDDNKKISLLPQEDKKRNEEKIAKIKDTASQNRGVDYFVPEKKEKKKNNKKNKKPNFWQNISDGFTKLFDGESKIRKEKIVPKYNLPETKIKKQNGAHKVELSDKKYPEHVFSAEPVEKNKLFPKFETPERKKEEIEKKEKPKSVPVKPLQQVDAQESKPKKKIEDRTSKNKKEDQDRELDVSKMFDDILGGFDSSTKASLSESKSEKKDDDISKELEALSAPAITDNPKQEKKIKYKSTKEIELSEAHFEDDEDAVEISLVPKAIRKADNRFKQNLIFIFTWVLLCTAFVGGMYWFLTAEVADLGVAIDELKSQKSTIQKDLAEMGTVKRKVRVLENKLKESKALLDDHLYWTHLFDGLETHTHSQVSYTGFSGGAGDSLTLKATAPSYNIAAKQLLIFQSAKGFASDVEISGISQTKDKESGSSHVSFSITLTLNQDIFKYKDNSK